MRAPLALLVLFVAPVFAQSAEGWRAYPSYNEISALTASPDGLWASADGGVFFYSTSTGELETVTSIDGLEGGPVGALAFDEARGLLWIGYESGVVESLDPDSREIQKVFGVSRADQYASRGIRRIDVEDNVLYLSTDFGVVVLDADARNVRSAYTRLANVEAGTPVNDVLLAPLPDGQPGIWAASDGGLVYASLATDNLQAPGAWTRADLEGAAFSLTEYDGRVFAGGGPVGARDLYRRSDAGVWERQLFIDNVVTDLLRFGDRVYGQSPTFVYVIPPSAGDATVFEPIGATVQSGVVVGPDGTVWASDDALGLFPIPDTAPGAGRITITPQVTTPPGPLSTNITDIDVGADGVLWLVTETLESAGFASVGRLEGETWTAYRSNDPSIDIARQSFRAASVGPDGSFYAGSNGDGVTVFPPDGSAEGAVNYTPSNSSLRTATGEPNFVVVDDVAFEDDVVWMLNASSLPLHRFDGEQWVGFPYPAGIPATAAAKQLAIDEFGQKWIALEGAGLGAWDTGDDPLSAADDRAVRFTGGGSGSGIPGNEVVDVVVDGRGRVWIGTDRGVAFVFSPSQAFGGSPELATPQWPRLEDGRDFLLRDVEVFDLEVDPAGQVWVGTSSGAYLINADGDGLVRTVTAATSPLPSDGVFSIAVDPGSGRVFFVTSEGLFSSPGDATRFDPRSEELVAAPQPFRPAESSEGVVVRGLSSPTSQVRVVTVAGDVVFSADVSGGSFRWDGRDQQGRPVPSGVYLVAAVGSDGSSRAGKVAVLR
ncbi:two-component regulator propeller domain-containing protein [Rubrivirga sp.]|uniref:type IX secretion system anionic LPS delivery protein PorZ n=1 Tax=Rubrivirga sp. TaxID=1885344 RepID=UPI003C71E438